ncbi:MAG: multiheme c-type cytochrome [Blastocatellia bacterium]
MKSLKTFCLLALLAPALPGLLVRARQAHFNAQAQRASSCRDCHQQIFDSYTGTAHFNTSSPAAGQTIKGDFSGGHHLLRTRSESVFFKLERRADGFYQTGHAAQKEVRSERFDLALGSGRKGQSYLFWKDGLLYQLPVSWLVGTRQWINSPGYEDGKINFDRVITPRCLECHATSFKLERTPNSVRYTSDYELGIACQKCHGDGRQHAAHHTAHTEEKAGKFILNLARFSRERQLDNCALCHSGMRELRRPPFTYRPGEALDDYLQPAPERETASADVHGNQIALLRRSRCFQQSQMSCATCHNVHRPERELTPMAAKCLQCHQTGQCKTGQRLGARMTANCIDCHMPNQKSRLIVIDAPAGKFAPEYRSHLIGVYPQVAKQIMQTLKQ